MRWQLGKVRVYIVKIVQELLYYNEGIKWLKVTTSLYIAQTYKRIKHGDP